MSTPIEKINVEEIRGVYFNEHGAGDYTTPSLKLLAEKINEIIDFCNNKAITLNLCKHEYDIKDGATCTKCGQVRVFPIHIID